MRSSVVRGLLAGLVAVVGFIAGVNGTATTFLAFASGDWTNNWSDTGIGPYGPTSGSTGQKTWDYLDTNDATACTEGETPSTHYTDIDLRGDGYQLGCPNFVTTYVSSLYVKFHVAMSGYQGLKIGEVDWYQGSTFLTTTDLTLFGTSSPYSMGYSVIPCNWQIEGQPDNVHVEYGVDYGYSNPALGNCITGFKVLIQCCSA